MKFILALGFIALAFATPSRYFDYILDYPYFSPQEQADQTTRELQYDASWPAKHPDVGQITGVAVDNDDNVVIVHRADRVWGGSTFDQNNDYKEKGKGKIKDPVMLTLSKRDGKILHKTGSNLFYLPHGITVDDHNNVWVTDVALHQVFKFKPKSNKPDLILGEAFIHGSDPKHFCKPTDVVVASCGHFFVADGYCNHRIMKFAPNGTFLTQWGHAREGNGDLKTDELEVPHSLTLAEDEDILCVADREHERIACYYAGLKNSSRTGEAWGSLQRDDFGRIYAIAYDKNTGVMHMVNGKSPGKDVKVRGTSFDTRNGKIIDNWTPPNGFQQPHDVTVSNNGDNVYVADIGQNRVLKFSRSPIDFVY